MKTRFLITVILLMMVSCGQSGADNEKKLIQEDNDALMRRQKAELLSFFLKPAESAAMPGTHVSIQFYNDAVKYFEQNQYDLARESAQEALKQDSANALAYALLGEIDYLQQRLPEAKENYQIAYALLPEPFIKEKLEKLLKEAPVEQKLSTYQEEHFIIRYHNSDKKVEGYVLRDFLRDAYRALSRDFAYYFSHQVVVLLYSQEEYQQITNAPHWASGLYDGKVRMPMTGEGYITQDLKALTHHELTHAFIASMSRNRAPSWINEGLAEYEENKVKPVNLDLFNTSASSGSLFPLDQLMNEQSVASMQDAAQISLFYQQSFHVVRYLVGRYGMFHLKQMLQKFGEGKNSYEAVQEILQISVQKLDREWKATFLKAPSSKTQVS